MSISGVIGAMCLAGLLPTIGFSGAPSQLADAAMNKDRVAVRSLVKQKADVNAPQPDGTTALMWAVRENDIESVDLLLAAGADVKAANHDGATAFYQASVNGNPAIIERLLKAGADVNGAILSTGETALMEAARNARVEAEKKPLAHGAQVNAKESLRETTALMWAVTQDHPEVVKVLIEHGAEINGQSKHEKVKPYGTFGPGMQVAKLGEIETGGLTPLVFAAREGAMASAKVLIDAKADIDKTTADGSSALLVAIQNGHYDAARFLIESGAKVSTPNLKGWSPLYMAIKNRNIETGNMPSPPNQDQALDFIKLLLDRGAQVNQRLIFETETHSASHVIWLKEEGATPFFRAAYAGDVEVMKLLLAHGADPAVTTNDHTTPLMAAAGVGFILSVVHHRAPEEDMAAVKLLLDLGADVNAVNDQGVTALMGAAHKGSNEQVQLLVDHGAKLDARDKGKYCGDGGKACPEGLIALHYAKGVYVTGQSAEEKSETVTYIEKLMLERGIPRPKDNRESGGVAALKSK
jgi:ankyrin repeat protein